MKGTYIILIAFVTIGICMVQACKKNTMPSHNATIDEPVIVLNGSQYITVNRGDTWIDSGATWTDSVTHQSGTFKGYTINTNVDSVYALAYTATNSNGYDTTVYRVVGVTDMSNNIDISGSYVTNQGGPAAIAKIGRALFIVYNVDLNFANIPDSSFLVIKSDSSVAIASVPTLQTGALLNESFYNTYISYAGVSPLTIAYTDSIIKGPAPYPVELQYAITPVLRQPHR